MNVITQLHPAEFPPLTSKTGFECKAEPVYMQRRNDAGEITGAQPIAAHSVIRRTDNGAALGITGDRYTIAHNQGIYETIQKAARDALPADQLRGVTLSEFASYGGTFTRFEIAFPGLTVPIRQYARDTEIQFKISVVNGFAGNSAVRVMAGAFDLICTNGMYLGEMDKAAARHTASYTPAKFAAFIAGQIQEYSQRARLYQQWAVTEFSRDDFSTVLESAGVFSERRREALLDQYSTEAASRGHTLWAAYSAATFYASHNSARFGVRGSGSADNVAATLTEREAEVARFVDSPAWRNVARVAA